jgi:hypothetical protein
VNTRVLVSCRVAFLLIGVPACAGATDVLKKMPKEGDVPYGKIVYVDDGKCPKGEIKEVTGGSQQKGVARKTRCVKRPPEVK